MGRVLVSGIGGNVGQGVLKNLRAIDSSIYIVGTNVKAVSAGNYLCDKVYEIPYAYDSEFKNAIEAIVVKEKIDLVIPTTDYECLYLSKYKIPQAITSPYSTNINFVNKYNTYLAFKEKGIPFVNSYLPSEYQHLPKRDYIFKPKEGRGSRGIVINPERVDSFSDEDYMIQDYIEGREMTSAFYVDKNGELHGIISMWRELANGATVSCYVTDEHQEKIKNIIEKIVAKFKIVGPCNMQSRITDEGEIFPFEINGRISGTNSIRSHFGFDDVRYILQEYLYQTAPDKPLITKGSAVRILSDIIYPGLENVSEIKNKTNKPILF